MGFNFLSDKKRAEESAQLQQTEEAAEQSAQETEEAEQSAAEEAPAGGDAPEGKAPGESEAPAEPEPKDTKMPKATRAKTRYMYVACDRAGNFLRDERGLLIYRPADNEDQPQKSSWPESIQEQVSTKLELRVKMDPIPEGLGKREKEQAKEAAKKKARYELKRLVEEQEKAYSPPSGQSQEPGTPVVTEPDSLKSEIKPEPALKSAESSHAEPLAPEKKTEAVTEQIKKTEESLNKDHNDILDMLQGESDEIKELAAKAKDASAQSAEIGRQVMKLARETRSIVGDAGSKVDRIVRGQGENQDNQEKLISKANQIKQQIEELAEPVQTMEGKLKQLDKIGELQALLENKGLILNMEIPPLNAEEEDVINLVRYSQKITEQLGYAARELLRKQKALNSQERSRADEQQALEQELRDARAKGFREGRMEAVNRLVSKYEDIDALRLTENGSLHTIWTFLTELGVEIDGEGRFVKDAELEFRAEEAQGKMAQYSGVDGEGRFRVVKTGLTFQGEIILKAEFARIPEPDFVG